MTSLLQECHGKCAGSIEIAFVRRFFVMKVLRGSLITGLFLAALLVSSLHAWAATVSAGAADGTPHLLTELRFNSTTPMTASSAAAANPGWVIGAQNGGSIGVSATSSASAIFPPLSSSTSVDALKGSYPVPTGVGGQYMWASYSVANLNTEDIYIEFWAKMPSQYKGGCKFVKVFGKRSPITGDADTTITTDYTGVDFGAIRQISFGDGTALRNDSQNVINLDGSDPQWIGRSYGTAVVKTPQMSDFPSTAWGTMWHHFRIHIKFNSGTTEQNEVPNGEYYLEIDGKVYVDATGLFNRNPANGPINYIEFFGWAQKDPHPFELMYDDIRISTGGFMTTPLPEPPSDVSAR